MDVRQAAAVNALGDPLPPKVLHRATADAEVGQGNHRVSFGGVLADALFGELEIFHFPARTKAQFINKIAKGGAAYSRNDELPVEFGSNWRQLFELYKAGKLGVYYDQIAFDDEAVRAGLRSGTLVRDRRLQQSFAARSSLGSFVRRTAAKFARGN